MPNPADLHVRHKVLHLNIVAKIGRPIRLVMQLVWVRATALLWPWVIAALLYAGI